MPFSTQQIAPLILLVVILLTPSCHVIRLPVAGLSVLRHWKSGRVPADDRWDGNNRYTDRHNGRIAQRLLQALSGKVDRGTSPTPDRMPVSRYSRNAAK